MNKDRRRIDLRDGLSSGRGESHQAYGPYGLQRVNRLGLRALRRRSDQAELVFERAFPALSCRTSLPELTRRRDNEAPDEYWHIYYQRSVRM
jgi:hypothetical protein